MMRTTLIGALLLSAGCMRNPATGKMQLNLLSRDQEQQMGQEAKKETEQTIGVYKESDALAKMVEKVGKSVAAVSTEPQDPFSYEIADDSSVNAFALPGGPVFITRGLLGYLNSEAELAAVLGHETGHVVAHHSANQMSKAQVAQLGLGLGSIISPTVANLAQVAGAGLQILFLKYSRDDETQADELGFRFMTKAGYDPNEMIPLFVMLDGVSNAAGAGKTPEWLETHPDPGNRKTATETRLKTELKGSTAGMKVNRDDYLKLVDNIVFGDDPRQGFFKGDVFYHPGLKLQWTLPKGWAHQNSPEAVMAGSPNQDAILQLSPAGKISPDEAAKKIFSQQGIQAGQPVDIHGAKLARAFQAQTQQGVIEGVIAFFEREGNTFMLVGYTKQGGLQTYGNDFASSMGSFGDVHDAGVLDVKPARVKLVKLDAPMSAADFQAKYPSTIKPEEVALINGVAGGGQIPAGYAKQVLGGPGH